MTIKGKTNSVAKKTLSFLSTKAFLTITIVIFVFQASYMALSTEVGVPPDEHWHIGLIDRYSKNGADFFIDDQAGYYYLGDVTKNPSRLYHYTLSFPYRLSPFNQQATIKFLRFINILLGCASLFFIWLLILRLTLSKLTANLAIFMMANTIMFPFLSAAINYDNLIILISAVSLWLTAALLKQFNPKKFLALLIIFGLGFLTKVTFVPLALLLSAALVVKYVRKLKAVAQAFVKSYKPDRLLLVSATCVALLLVILTAIIYVGNFVKYEKFVPKCDQVHTIKQCQKSALYVRNKNLVEHPQQKNLLSPPAFAVKWTKSMSNRTYGVFAHRKFSPAKSISIFIGLLFLSFVIATLLKFDRTKSELNWLLAGSLVYMIVLMFANYNIYKHYHFYGLGLQGRYGFLVLFVLYGAGIYYLLKLVEKFVRLKTTIAAIILAVFFISSWPSYIVRSDSTWHSAKFQRLNASLKDKFKVVVP